MFAVATTGPPALLIGVTTVWALERELRDWVELLKAVEPESWLPRGALLMVPAGMPSLSRSLLKIGVVLFRIRGAWAITSMARGDYGTARRSGGWRRRQGWCRISDPPKSGKR